MPGDFCAACGCSNHSGNVKKRYDKAVSFHSFPRRNPSLLQQWLLALKRVNYTPTRYSKLCSEHFEESCFQYQNFTNSRHLKWDAVPTLFCYRPNMPCGKCRHSHGDEEVVVPNSSQRNLLDSGHLEELTEHTNDMPSIVCLSTINPVPMQTNEILHVELVIDNENIESQKKETHSDDESTYECNFNIHHVIANTLANLDVKSQIQDAITNSSTELGDIAKKFQITSQMFAELDDRLQRIHATSACLRQLQARSTLNTSQPVKTSNVKVSKGNPPPPPLPPPPLPFEKTTYYPGNQKKQGDASMDVIPVARVNISKPSMLPPVGNLVRKELTVGSSVYAIRGSIYGVWYKAKITEIRNSPTNEKCYKIKYDSKKLVQPNMSGKQLAYHELADVLLPVGTRIIAQYKDEYWATSNSMYAGIVAEPPKVMNNYRYLIFFDDGYAQYVQHNETRVVCEASHDVWEDIHPDSKEFIRNYLLQYPERPMVKLQKGHIVKTEWNGKWWIAKVMEVDASLVKMYFHADKRTEWIYRGSTRLGPLYNELANAEAVRLTGKGSRRHNLVVAKKKSAPYVEYTRGLDGPMEANNQESEDEGNPEKKQTARKHTSQNVARKSTTPVKASEPKSKSFVEIDGSVERRSFTSPYERRLFVVHKCNVLCLRDIDDDPALHRGHNPLTIPSLNGWERHIVRHKNVSKRVVFYRAPCGRRLRTMDEIYSYLSMTKSKLTIDLFSIDSYVHIFSEFVPAKVLCYIKDISYGKENICVSGVNSLSREYPEYLEYSIKRIPNKGVNLNLDPEFLLCCDCDDNCSDSSKCTCQQLTQEAAGSTLEGYSYRRLTEPVITGIYECNHRCKCSSQCVNRIVQNGLQLRLQVFKTEKRGWGIRCLDDIPKGGFICIYAGQLLTEQGANEDGTQFGDEYLAELDYIEVLERRKEGYESDVVESSSESNEDPTNTKESASEADEEQNTTTTTTTTAAAATIVTTSNIEQKEKGVMSDDGSWGEDKQIGNSSDSDFEAQCGPVAPRHRSTRIKKLVLRRDTSDQDSNHSWNVQKQKENEAKSSLHSLTDKKVSTEKPKPKRSESHTSETSEESSCQSVFSSNFTSMKKTASMSDTFEQLKKVNMKRIPRVNRDSPVTIDSESEDDNSKTSKTSSSDQVAMERKTEKQSSRVQQSRFWSMPDPRNKNISSKDSTLNPGEPEKKSKHPSVRNFFGDEFCYVMDAKSLGNIGRYLNHSCGPNCFVQNVFVDTHDLRFPWVAFFALEYIRAGDELTWDYNYEVGSVPNKVLYCYCGSSKCRGRLL